MAPISPIREHANSTLDAAAKARRAQEFLSVKFLGAQGVSDPGQHYANYANMASNRMLSLYDDCALLLENNRIPAACVIARCMLETYAVAKFSLNEISKAFERHGIDRASDTVLAYINSSRIKLEEQKRFKQGAFSPKDYYLTQEALSRMENEEAAAKHILNAMRSLFADEAAITGKETSHFEMVYERLCEWTHPSQTSLFHAFAEQTWMIPTSIGPISLWDGALSSCSQGVHCVRAMPELRIAMLALADELTRAHKETAEQ